MKKTKMLPVIFRIDTGGDPIAIFPTEQWDWQSVACYSHIGQHGPCSRDYYNLTKPATKKQYEPLLKELTHLVGYKNLKVYKKWMSHYA